MDRELKITVGNNLKYIRFQKCWSQSFVCNQVGISIRTLSRAENGCGISKHTLNKLCCLYQIPMYNFYKEQEIKTSPEADSIEPIPDSVITKIVLQSDLFSTIQRESILRFNNSLQKDAVMLREDVEKVLPDIISNKKTYTLQDVITVAMAVNQITIKNIGNIAIA